MLMAAQQGKLPDENAAQKAKENGGGLSRQKTLQAFETAQTMQMEQIKKQATMQKQAAAGGGDEMEMMIDMFVE